MILIRAWKDVSTLLARNWRLAGQNTSSILRTTLVKKAKGGLGPTGWHSTVLLFMGKIIVTQGSLPLGFSGLKFPQDKVRDKASLLVTAYLNFYTGSMATSDHEEA